MLAPHHGKDAKLRQRGFAAENLQQALILIAFEAVLGDDLGAEACFGRGVHGARGGERAMTVVRAYSRPARACRAAPTGYERPSTSSLSLPSTIFAVVSQLGRLGLRARAPALSASRRGWLPSTARSAASSGRTLPSRASLAPRRPTQCAAAPACVLTTGTPQAKASARAMP